MIYRSSRRVYHTMHTAPRSVARVALALALTSFSAAARAQTDSEREEARTHFQRATQLLAQSRWLDAIPELEVARALAVTPSVLFNLGLAQRAVGRLRASRESFREFLRSDSSAISPARRAEAEGYVAELTQAFAHIELHVAPAEATVTLDGQPVPSHAPDLEVDPGTHLLSASARGFEHFTRTLEVRSGQRVVVQTELTPERVLGHLHVATSAPDARIEVDGSYAGASAADSDLPVGRHTVRVTAPGHQPFTETVTVSAGGTTRVEARLRSNRGLLSSPWFWTGVGVLVAAGLTVGAVFLFSDTAEPITPVWGVVPTYLRVGAGF